MTGNLSPHINDIDLIYRDIAPPGSHLYYSVLFCDKNISHKILALKALESKFQQIRFKSKEPQIIQMQFDFWENELTNPNPQHPITQYLQRQKLIDHKLLDILIAYKNDTNIQLYETEHDLISFYQNTKGVLEKIIFGEDLIVEFGCYLGRTHFLINIRDYIERGKIYISGERLLQHHVTLYDFSSLRQNQNMQDLLTEELLNIKSYLESLQSFLLKSKAFMPNYILSKIYLAQLKEIEKNLFSIFTHKVDLTPLRKFWIAWRNS
jgi:phytoene synthase